MNQLSVVPKTWWHWSGFTEHIAPLQFLVCLLANIVALFDSRWDWVLTQVYQANICYIRFHTAKKVNY